MFSFFKVKSSNNIYHNIMSSIIGVKINKTPEQTPTQTPEQTPTQTPIQTPTQTPREEKNQRRILELERLEKEGIEADLTLKREMNNLELERVLKEIEN